MPLLMTASPDQASTLRQLARERNASERNVSVAQNRQQTATTTRVLTITSGKGGVGKTVVVSNMAICLSRLGYRVLILDADLGLANIDVVMGLDPEYDLSHVINGEKRLPEIIVRASGGVGVIPAASGDLCLANLRQEQQLNLLAQFDAMEDHVDFLLIDSGAGISSNVIYFNLASQIPLIVVTPEPTSLTDAYAVIKVLSQDHRVARFIILVNRAKDEAEAQGVFERLLNVSDRFLSSVSLDYLGFLPDDYRVSRAIRSRRPIVDLYPTAPVSQSLAEVSRRIATMPVRDYCAGYPGFMRSRRLARP